MKTITEPNPKRLTLLVANLIQNKIKNLSKQKKTIILGLVGGRSVIDIYSELSKRDSSTWKQVHFFLIDERNVPIDDDESNFKLVKEHLLEPLLKRKQITSKNIHPLDTSLEPDLARKQYLDELNKEGRYFDIAILSSGEDNHIAAIYPKLNYSNEEEFSYLTNSPKLPPQRFTVSPNLLANTRSGIILFCGNGKKAALNHFLSKKNTKTLPEKTLLKIKDLTLVTDQEIKDE